MSFFQLSPSIGATIFCIGAIISGLVVYFILRRLLEPYLSDDTQILSSSILVRVGTLYALILALVFSEEFADYIDVKILSLRRQQPSELFTTVLKNSILKQLKKSYRQWLITCRRLSKKNG